MIENRIRPHSECAALAAALCLALFSDGLLPPAAEASNRKRQSLRKPSGAAARFEQATFGAGCSCISAVFQQAGAIGRLGLQRQRQDRRTSKSARDDRPCRSRSTRFDPGVIYKMLGIFWKTHDPTTLNRQGPTSARSIVR